MIRASTPAQAWVYQNYTELYASIALIDRQRLGQIPREIGIEPSHHAHVIREQLQRQDSQQGADLRIGFWNDDQVIAVGAQARVLFALGRRTC